MEDIVDPRLSEQSEVAARSSGGQGEALAPQDRKRLLFRRLQASRPGLAELIRFVPINASPTRRWFALLAAVGAGPLVPSCQPGPPRRHPGGVRPDLRPGRDL